VCAVIVPRDVIRVGVQPNHKAFLGRKPRATQGRKPRAKSAGFADKASLWLLPSSAHVERHGGLQRSPNTFGASVTDVYSGSVNKLVVGWFYAWEKPGAAV